MAPRSPISPSTAALRAQRLSVIAEDGTVLPPIPARSAQRQASESSFNLPIQGPTASYSNAGIQTSNRPQSRRWTDKPPHHSADASPPGYEHWDDNAPRSKRSILLGKVRGNKQIARRGGWKRLVIGLVVLVVIIIALGVGLGVGLQQRNSNNSSNSGNNNGNGGNTTAVFPEGSYAIPVYSAVVDTSCTAIASTWLCFPYNLYNAGNPSTSLATYTWIISSGDTSSSSSPPSSFNISTTQNPFADIFTNVPLTLTNAGTSEEHYSFTVALQKIVVPRTSIAPNGATTNCYYNNTVFQGELYTRKPSMNISSMAAASASSIQQDAPASANNWQHWPYAVNVTQSISGGNGVPDCYALNADGSTGARVTTGLTPQDVSKSCVCGYRNFGF